MRLKWDEIYQNYLTSRVVSIYTLKLRMFNEF